MASAAGASPTISAATAINESSERRTASLLTTTPAAYPVDETARHQEMG
jgi:hypothetical protein